MCGKTFRCGPQNLRHARIIRHGECRQQLSHVRDATPLVASEQSDCQTSFIENLSPRAEAKRDLTAFGLVQAGEITGIELNLAVA
ncbi:hypothetical protein MEA186_28677 [Mesorhizobium amorphae CCNWGS0123]|uniref:Uncharacterized protein n=2 Tax=Mesorhizobium TaxID=68287 RepID=G6YIB5_9HYPH|nr:hypothetical protein MEA186_28677 [Mesorhizobium amorphae CCNWGS0123]